MDKTLSVNDSVSLKWKSKCGRYTVSISHSCLSKMFEMGKTHYPCEVGTSLVGCYSDDGFDAFILDMAPLCSDSRGSASSFYRGIKGLQLFFVKLRQRYVGKRYYVGEWHSHPNGSPSPSGTDDINQLAIAADRKTNCPENILVILGGNLLSAPEVGVFVYSRRRGRIHLVPDDI